MFTLIPFVVFLFIQSTVSTHAVDSHEDLKPLPDLSLEAEISEETEIEHSETEEIVNPEDCAEKDYSLISYSDLKYLIDKEAEKLQIQQHFEDAHYPELKKVFEKYTNELEGFRKQIEERPDHLLHILNDIAKMRERLQPMVEKIAYQLQDYHDIENRCSDIKIRTNQTLKQLEKIKNMCNFYCNAFDLRANARFGLKTNRKLSSASESTSNDFRYCVRLKDLNEKIHMKFSQLDLYSNADFSHDLNEKDKIYAEKLGIYKEKLKEAAVKQFGTTMYDILSLQDEYYHYSEYLNTDDVSTIIHSIDEDIADSNLRLIGLNRDLKKYMQYCKTCDGRRIKRNAVHVLKHLNKIPRKNNAEIDILDKFLDAKVDEILDVIKSNYTDTFDTLDKAFDDADSIDTFLKKIIPIQTQIQSDVELEKQAARELSNRIPDDLMKKVISLSKELKRIIEDLESAKQYIQEKINV